MYEEFTPDADNALHLLRKETATKAIEAVLRDYTADDLPYGGDIEDALDDCVPILEKVFDMPALRPARGTPKWMDYMLGNLDECSFEDLATVPKLFKAWLASMLQRGDRKGRPRKSLDEVFIWSTYKPLKKKGKGMISPRTVC